MALFTEEISPKQVPNILGSTQPKAFLADSVIDPTTLPVDQSLGLSPTASIQQPFMFEPMKSAQQPSIVGGMFSPELRSAAEMEYLQNRQRAMQNEALAYAQLTPMQQAQYGFYRGGQQLGDVVGGALGGQDPQLRMIAQRQSLISQLDLSDPNSLIKGSQLASQAGDLQFASSLVDRAKALQESFAKQTLEGAQATEKLATANKTVTEQQRIKSITQQLMNTYNLTEAEASAIASNPDLLKSYYTPKSAQGLKLLESGKYTPESVTNWQSGKGELEPIDKQTKTTSDFLSKAVELGFPANAKYGDYSQDQVAKINKALFDDELRLATAKATNIRVGVDVKGEEAFAKTLGETDAKAVANARDKRDASIAALNSLKQLNTLNQNDLISGTFATGRVGANNLLASLGLASGKDIDRLASSENYQKVAGDVILSTLGGRLGAGFSNEDRKFIQGLVPQLENSALARKQLIDFMVNKNQEIVDETTRLEDYAREKRSLKGYIPKIPIVNTGTSSLKNLSDAELLKQAEQLGLKVKPR
jgi:hypothetical protein